MVLRRVSPKICGVKICRLLNSERQRFKYDCYDGTYYQRIAIKIEKYSFHASSTRPYFFLEYKYQTRIACSVVEKHSFKVMSP